MAKFLVETYYTCTFKVNHYLDEINETELKNLEYDPVELGEYLYDCVANAPVRAKYAPSKIGSLKTIKE